MPSDGTELTVFRPQTWKTGQSGNPKGRPRASRDRFITEFMEDIHESWRVYGRPVLMTVALTDPSTFLRVAASLIPRDIDITVTHASAERLSDDDIVRLIEEDAARDTSEAA